MCDLCLIVGAIVLVTCGWWLIYVWFLMPQIDRFDKGFDSAWDHLEGRIMRANGQRDAALAEVKRLKAELAEVHAAKGEGTNG